MGEKWTKRKRDYKKLFYHCVTVQGPRKEDQEKKRKKRGPIQTTKAYKEIERACVLKTMNFAYTCICLLHVQDKNQDMLMQ